MKDKCHKGTKTQRKDIIILIKKPSCLGVFVALKYGGEFDDSGS